MILRYRSGRQALSKAFLVMVMLLLKQLKISAYMSNAGVVFLLNLLKISWMVCFDRFRGLFLNHPHIQLLTPL